MVASPVENPPAEASPDFAYEPCRGSKEAVIGECQKEEAAGLEPSNFPVPCSCAGLRGPHTLILGGASSGPPMSEGHVLIDLIVLVSHFFPPLLAFAHFILLQINETCLC
jgi:hypothetical protein